MLNFVKLVKIIRKFFRNFAQISRKFFTIFNNFSQIYRHFCKIKKSENRRFCATIDLIHFSLSHYFNSSYEPLKSRIKKVFIKKPSKSISCYKGILWSFRFFFSAHEYYFFIAWKLCKIIRLATFKGRNKL